MNLDDIEHRAIAVRDLADGSMANVEQPIRPEDVIALVAHARTLERIIEETAYLLESHNLNRATRREWASTILARMHESRLRWNSRQAGTT